MININISFYNKMILLLTIITISLILIYTIFLYISKTYSKDLYSDLFISNKDLRIYSPGHGIYYDKTKKYNICIDGEPDDMSNIKADFLLTTKKEPSLLPKKIPYIYFPLFMYNMRNNIDCFIKKPNEKIKKTKFCCFMYSNCSLSYNNVKNRKDFYFALNKASNNRVDNLGKCYNKNYKRNEDTIGMLKPYKFFIAFENTRLKGYITEKLINPMLARCIPIYLGAEDVAEYFNPKSFIDVRKFKDFDECIEYILKVDSDDELYNSILKQPYLYGNKYDKKKFSYLFNEGVFFEELEEKLPKHLHKYLRYKNEKNNK